MCMLSFPNSLKLYMFFRLFVMKKRSEINAVRNSDVLSVF